MIGLRDTLRRRYVRWRALRDERGVHVGSNVTLHSTCRVMSRYGGEVWLGDNCRIEPGALLISSRGDIRLANDVYIGPYAVLYGAGGLTVGEHTAIASHTVVLPSNHIVTDREKPFMQQGVTMKGISIGRNVWIGARCSILDGVSISDGAVVAAGAVVNRDVEPFEIVGGVPANHIGWRAESVPVERRGASLA